MAHIENINTIPVQRSALECLPESVAREDSVLPVCFDDGALRVIVPDSFPFPEHLPELLDKIAFLIDGNVLHDTADKSQIDRAVDDHYRRLLGEVTNCPLQLQVSCPRRWIDLVPTEDDNVRYCGTCSQNVYLCRSVGELEHRAVQNQCVAYHEYKSDTLGLQLFPGTDGTD